VALLSLSACSVARDEPTQQADDRVRPLSVYVVNDPLAYFATRIGGDHVEVAFPAPRDVDPAFWLPSPEVIGRYQAADLILENGAGYARWTQQATLPRASRVDTGAGFRDRWIRDQTGQTGLTHVHGTGAEHSHGSVAFTTWLDPSLATLHARAIAQAFERARPAAADDFRAGLAALEGDLVRLDRRLAAAFAPFSGQPLLFSHPVYQYLARRYDLAAQSLHWEPGARPSPADWREFEEMLVAFPARMLLWEGEPHPEVESRLRSLGVRSLVFAPGGNRPRSSDWLGLMHSNAERLEAAADGGATGTTAPAVAQETGARSLMKRR
jgi:zinc transport system substrate-binding protein